MTSASIIQEIKELPPTEQAEVIQFALALAQAGGKEMQSEIHNSDAQPILEIIENIGAAVPEAAWNGVPTDGAKNLNHYLYGHPKKP